MTTFLPRSAWTDTPRGGATLTATKLVGVSVHYPAAGNVNLADASRDSIIRRLQGYRAFHVGTRGWSDIGYQVAIDGKGRVWDLRGIHRVPAATASGANPDANYEWGACLFLLGNNEHPTEAQIAAFREWRETVWLNRWPNAKRISGHRDVPGAQTACPGEPLTRAIANGDLSTKAPRKEDDDMPTADEIWNHRLPTPGDDGNDMSAKWMLAQAHHRAGQARMYARQAAVQAEKNRKAIAALVENIDGLDDAVVRRVVKTLGEGIDVTLTIEAGGMTP